MKFSEAWRRANSVTGRLVEAEGRLLFDSVKKTNKDDLIIELGTLYGHTALLMAQTGRHVLSIDIAPRVEKIDGVELVVGESTEVAEEFNDIDFLFVDADHEYESVKKDIKAWLPKVKVGGKILFHDYESWPGVTKAVNEAIEDGLLEKGEQAKSLLCTTKLQS